MRALGLATLGLAVLISLAQADQNKLIISDSEIEQVLSHGPWPLPAKADASNKMSGNANAISLGRKLFFSKKLSSDKQTSCATCHQPAKAFTDGLQRANGRIILDRNTPALINLRHNRWFGWAGQSDNLWAQSIIPISHNDEMDLDHTEVTAIISDQEFRKEYNDLFGSSAHIEHEQNLVNIGKLLAAFQETLETESTQFDSFRDSLASGNRAEAAKYPVEAQRGLLIFIGRGNCSLCHTGPLFTNGEFHDAGVPYFVEPGRVDTGRHGGIKLLKASPYTLEGQFSDDPGKKGAWKVRQVLQQHANFGTFRVPSLRNVANTQPYMHNGSLASLEEVVRHYSNIDIERLHADGEAILVPLKLSEQEIQDLVSFLKTLSSPVTD